jgi:hypothetical protein
MRWILSLLVVAALATGCKNSELAALEAKCDASLRQKVEELASTDADAVLDVLGQTTVALDADRQKQLVSAGAQVQQATGEMFTARIPVKRVGQVAALDFVKSLALSQVREPLAP